MKLAVFLRAPQVWGAEKSLLTLLSSEAAQQHAIDLYIAPGSPLADELTAQNIPWQKFTFVDHSSLSSGGLSAASPSAILSDVVKVTRQALRTRKALKNYDAVLTFGLWETAEIALAGRLSKTPVIFDFHVTFAGRLGQAALRGIATLATGVIAPSAATYRQAGLKPNPHSMKAVPRPVSFPESLPSTPRNRQKLTVGIFGQIDERKRVLDVVNALAPLAPSVSLLVVGLRPQTERTSYEKDVMEAIERVGQGWRVIDRTDRPLELMGLCDAVLNASHHEAFGRTVVEAAGMGALPVVVAGGGPEEIIHDIGHGLVASSMEHLARVVGLLASEFKSGKEIRLGQAEIVRIQNMYSPAGLGQRYFSEIARLSSPNRAEE